MIFDLLKKYVFGLLAIALFFLQACFYQPAPLYEFEPIDDINFWDKGDAYVAKDKGDITLTISSDRTGKREAGFYVNIYNRSEKVFLVDPYDFSIEYLANDTASVIGDHMHAVNPEERLIKFDKLASEEEADFKNDENLHLTFSLIDFIGDVASIGSRSYSETMRDMEHDLQREERMEMREYEHAERMENYNQQKLFWSESVLRKTTLGPNSSADGLVFFPINPEAKFVKLIFPIDNFTFTVIYKQIIIPMQ